MPTIDGVFLSDATVIVTNVSPDGMAAEAVVRGLQLVLEPVGRSLTGDPVSAGRSPAEPPLAATRSQTFFFPLKGEAADLTANLSVRGQGEVKPGARLALVTRAGGQTFADDPMGGANDGNTFTFTHAVAVPAGSGGLVVTLVLLADRDHVGNELPGALLNISSVDVEFKPAPAGKGYKG